MIQAKKRIDDGCTIDVDPYIALAFEASKVNTDRWYSHRPLSIAISEFSWLEAKDNALSPSTEPIHVILWFDVVPVMFGPNISGAFATDIEAAGTSTGAFYKGGTDQTTGSANDSYGGVIGFEASRSSPIFGSSDTVQPPALQSLACIKT